VFLRDKYFTGVGYLPDGILERTGRIRVYHKEMILSYEVVVVILYCENNYRTTFISFAVIALLLLSFVFIDFSVPISNLCYDLREVYLVNIEFLYLQLLVFSSVHGQGLVVN